MCQLSDKFENFCSDLVWKKILFILYEFCYCYWDCNKQRFLSYLTAFLLKLCVYCGDNKTCFIQAENVTPLKYFPKLQLTKLLYFLTGFYLWNKERCGNKTMWEGKSERFVRAKVPVGVSNYHSWHRKLFKGQSVTQVLFHTRLVRWTLWHCRLSNHFDWKMAE